MSGIRVASGRLFFFFAYDAGFEIALAGGRKGAPSPTHCGFGNIPS